MLYRVRIRLDAWYANDDFIAPPPAGHPLEFRLIVLFDLICIIFVALNTAPWNTNCKLKNRFSAQSTRFNNCFLLLDCMFAHAPPRLLHFLVENQRHTMALNMYYSVSTARCVFASDRLYREIPETHQRKMEGKRSFLPVWRGPQSHIREDSCVEAVNTVVEPATKYMRLFQFIYHLTFIPVVMVTFMSSRPWMFYYSN